MYAGTHLTSDEAESPRGQSPLHIFHALPLDMAHAVPAVPPPIQRPVAMPTFPLFKVTAPVTFGFCPLTASVAPLPEIMVNTSAATHSNLSSSQSAQHGLPSLEPASSTGVCWINASAASGVLDCQASASRALTPCLN